MQASSLLIPSHNNPSHRIIIFIMVEEHHILLVFVAAIISLVIYITFKIYSDTQECRYDNNRNPYGHAGWRKEGCYGPGGDGIEMSVRLFPGE